MRRLALLVAPVLLTGCVSVVVPTATPAPTPAAVTFSAPAGAVSTTFELAGGDYSGWWYVGEPDCSITLDLVGSLSDYDETLASRRTTAVMASPAPVFVFGVPPGVYNFFADTTCPWTASLTQVK